LCHDLGRVAGRPILRLAQKKKSPRLQLNIRLTPEQNELIKQKLEQTQISKTQLIIDSINNNPIYIIPNLEQTISQIKYLGNKVNELSNKIETKDENTEKLLQEIQQGCDEFWQLLKSLKQEKQKQV
ncbi:plasmid mobilization protein, partial [Megamonas funiformis]|uniref:plasmid mobilization protein n=2 Tax=Megamonas TaxID=158846 RepID=UPI00388DC8B0